MATDNVAVELRDALTKNAKRVVDLFREWDEDGDGTISKKEFRKAIPLIVQDVPKAAVDQLFDDWDPDKSGMISLAELIKKLRRGGEVELDESLKAGGAGEISTESTTKIAVRKGLTKRGSSLGNIDIDESSDKSVAQQLRDILSKNGVRVVDLFREWDEDGNGSVSKKEFRKAMPLLGFDAPRAQIDQLFDSFDPDGGGAISIDELNKALRRGGEVKLAADLQPGARGKIGTVRKGLTKRGSSLGNIDIDESSDKSVAQQLRDILSKNGVRVVDLFREWDEDGNGSVSKKEFRKAMPLLGFDAPRAVVDEVFDSFDPDGGGAISIDELNKALRRGGEVKLAADLQAGARGKIETASKNKSTRLAASAGGAPRPSPRGSSPRDSPREPSPRQRAHSPRAVPSARPETAPLVGGRHGGGDGPSGLLSRAAAARPQSTEGASRPPSRSPSRSSLSVAGTSASVSSIGGRRSSRLRMQRLEEEMPALVSASGNVRRAADVYLAGGYAMASRKQQHGALPPVVRVPQPPSGLNPNPRGRARGAGKGWSSGGANSPGRGRGIGSKEELEAALSAAQTALVMAKERVLSLEDQNYSLRQKLDGRGGLVTVTREKLAEAQQALQDALLTEADFAAIKQKYMQENFGVMHGGAAPGASSAAQPDMT